MCLSTVLLKNGFIESGLNFSGTCLFVFCCCFSIYSDILVVYLLEMLFEQTFLA